MTVKELMEALAKMPPEAAVIASVRDSELVTEAVLLGDNWIIDEDDDFDHPVVMLG